MSLSLSLTHTHTHTHTESQDILTWSDTSTQPKEQPTQLAMSEAGNQHVPAFNRF
jgi:hypothetical protein